jgi:hypothetical protein
MLRPLFTEPFDVTSTELITCGAGIKHVTTGHTLRGLTRVLHTCLCRTVRYFYSLLELRRGPSLHCEGKASTMYSGSRLV